MDMLTSDRCLHCGMEAMATTEKGRLCGGHALVETAREWNQGNWDWTVAFDSALLAPPRPDRRHLVA